MTEPSPVRARVQRLLAWCRPSDIAWLVVAIVVDSVNGVFRRRALSYVSSKRDKVSRPLVTNGDPASAVLWVTRTLGVQTSLLHRDPRLVQARFRQTVRGGSRASGLVVGASARLRQPVCQRVLPYVLGFSARALTQHPNKRVRPGRITDRNHGPAAESVTRRDDPPDLAFVQPIAFGGSAPLRASAGTRCAGRDVRNAHALLDSAVTCEQTIATIKAPDQREHGSYFTGIRPAMVVV